MSSSEAEHREHQKAVASRRAALREMLATLFPDPVSLTLEIGSGHGHWLVEYGARHPDRQCVGVDLIGDRVERANRKRDRLELANVRFLKSEAMELLDALPQHVALQEGFVLFPDPWPKKRHWKNRLFCQRFLEELAARCSRGVRCHFRTDHAEYFEWAMQLVNSQSIWKLGMDLKWPFERETVFQARSESFQSLIIVKQ